MKWIIRAIGSHELDFRFSLLQPRNGYRRFPSGISALKQVTGREHREIQRYILGLIADSVRPEFIVCIRALLDLRYLTQLLDVNTDILNDITRALEIFHSFKQFILDLGLRVGKKGNRIPHFEIPKLEFLQSIVPSIMWSGALPQWSADVTERLHIDLIKAPRDNTNNLDYYSQICRHLDRDEKRRHFDLATAIHTAANIDTPPLHRAPLSRRTAEPDWMFDTYNSNGDVADWKSELPQVAQVYGPPRPVTDFFAIAATEIQAQPTPLFPRTFATPTTAFHLNIRADISCASIEDISTQFTIPDLLPALRDFFSHYLRDQQSRTIAGRRGPLWNAATPFEDVRVWHSVRVQMKGGCSPTRTPDKLFASPPNDEWPTGRCDTAIFSIGESGPERPPPGLGGKPYPSPQDVFYADGDGRFFCRTNSCYLPSHLGCPNKTSSLPCIRSAVRHCSSNTPPKREKTHS